MEPLITSKAPISTSISFAFVFLQINSRLIFPVSDDHSSFSIPPTENCLVVVRTSKTIQAQPIYSSVRKAVTPHARGSPWTLAVLWDKDRVQRM